ncbi:MAG: hypothetical protein LBB83_10085 [Treponema sp.]|jgi:hypothetical protein|nr:hypothetical protein [Treponema sp.]
MRKTVFAALLLGVIFAGPAFADMYAVESVSGKVEREVSPGKWQAVARGMILDSATVIDTGLNAQLVLNAGGRFVIIRARQKGTVENLIGGASGSGVRIGERAAESETGVSSGETSVVPNASATRR